MAGSVGQDLIEKLKLLESRNLELGQRIRAVHVMLDHYIEELLKEERIHFTTLFTKISYLSLKFKLNRELTYFLHRHRKNISEERNDEETYRIAAYALTSLVSTLEKVSFDSEISQLVEKPEVQRVSQRVTKAYIPYARIHAFAFDPKIQTISAYAEDSPEDEIVVKVNVVGKNDDFNSICRFLEKTKKFPVTLHLEEIEVDEEDHWTPRRIIFEPDYLVDITTVSECFKPGESNPLFYFIKKFIPVFQNKYLIIGNTANFFLDEIFYDSSVPFEALIKQTFRLSPLGFSMMNDNEVKEVIKSLRNHYYTIKDVVQNHLERHGITPENTSLEPSFYAPKVGFQGRLDLYSHSPATEEARIVELKSGKPYRANTYGLNINHYVQTLLYDLMVSSVFRGRQKTSSFILYSSQASDPLRFAPPLKIQQKEALVLRNQLVEIDYLLANVDIDNNQLFSFIDGNAIKSDGFARRDIEKFQKIYQGASNLSRKYFNAYTAFVAREQILAKTGEFGLDKSSGLAGLWLDDMQEKIDNFEVLNALEITEVKSERSYTILEFKRTEKTAANANFRKGDLGVLYPFTHGNQSVLRNQIYKCSIISIAHDHVQVRLRNKQQNISPFSKEVEWHIEHDHLDHGFNSMFQDLFLFLGQDEKYQNLMLGERAPQKPLNSQHYQGNGYLTEEQAVTISEMISSPEYYLLWGPPGTGKTSVILYEYLKHIYLNSSKRILVLAYTNRAVDEICEAINRIGNNVKKKYFRIGSRYSTNTKFEEDLFVTKLEDIENRFDLLTLINNSRIIVSTLASIQGKKEIFSLIKVDEIIVDEASQILEPQLIGFLSHAPKFILIGDHFQLPAIVRQREDESEVHDEELLRIGLTERRNSLFERLFRKSKENKWDWSFGSLSHQGRMHMEIMNFVNTHFYQNHLSTIPSRTDLRAEIETNLLFGHRMVFKSIPTDQQSINYKTNQYEADAIADIVKEYFQSEAEINADSIGVITPYRAQISAIKLALQKRGITSDVSVDTVERYQGSARDIIIISLCLNLENQLKNLVNKSADGIDRKLNVALTRARKQIIILGNEEIMRANEVYSSLIDYVYEIK